MFYEICRAILYFSIVYIISVSGIFLTCNIANILSGIKTEFIKNEGQQMQLMKIQNTNTTIVTKQNTLLQEKSQTAILTKNNIQNNITSPVSYYTLHNNV